MAEMLAVTTNRDADELINQCLHDCFKDWAKDFVAGKTDLGQPGEASQQLVLESPEQTDAAVSAIASGEGEKLGNFTVNEWKAHFSGTHSAIFARTQEFALTWFRMQLELADNDKREVNELARRFETFMKQLHGSYLRLYQKRSQLSEELFTDWWKAFREVNDRMRQITLESRDKKWSVRQADAVLKELNHLLHEAQGKIEHRESKEEAIVDAVNSFGDPDGNHTPEVLAEGRRIAELREFVSDADEGFINRRLSQVQTLEDGLQALEHIVTRSIDWPSKTYFEKMVIAVDLIEERLQKEIKGTPGKKFENAMEEVRDFIKLGLKKSEKHRDAIMSDWASDDIIEANTTGPDSLEAEAIRDEIKTSLEATEKTLRLTNDRLRHKISNLQHLVMLALKGEVDERTKLSEIPAKIQEDKLVKGKGDGVVNRTMTPIYKTWGSTLTDGGQLKGELLEFANRANDGFLFNYTPGRGSDRAGSITLRSVWRELDVDFVKTDSFYAQLKAVKRLFEHGGLNQSEIDLLTSIDRGKGKWIFDYVDMDEITFDAGIDPSEITKLSLKLIKYWKKENIKKVLMTSPLIRMRHNKNVAFVMRVVHLKTDMEDELYAPLWEKFPDKRHKSILRIERKIHSNLRMLPDDHLYALMIASDKAEAAHLEEQAEEDQRSKGMGLGSRSAVRSWRAGRSSRKSCEAF